MKTITNEDFIKKAESIHGKRYNYSLVDYKTRQTPIKLICDIHGEFEITPASHLNNCGCKKCSGQYVRTKEEFIEEARQKHGDKFDYSLVEFKTYKDKINIKCPIHGVFSQTVRDHLNSETGCLKCGQAMTGLKKRLTKEQFIEKAINVHGDKYDYSLVEYINNTTPIKLICKETGIEITQTPSSHLEGRDALKLLKPYTNEEFIEKAKQIHGNKYDYSLVEYVNSNTKITIKCSIHGEFQQTPSAHISNKSGCAKCAGKVPYSKDDFLEAANKKYSNKYTYNLDNYINLQSRIIVKCSIHGETSQKAATHLDKMYGCPHCANIEKGLTKRNKLSEFIEDCNKIHDNKYDYSLVKMGTAHEKVDIKCPIHGVFKQSINNHKRGQTCPFCDRSKGEETIDKLLTKYNITFEKEKTFEGCFYKRVLFFDFYLPKENILIEYDGIQHYEPIKWFGGEEALIESQKRDEIKNNYCINNNIPLLRIRYDDNIETKLYEFLTQSGYLL